MSELTQQSECLTFSGNLKRVTLFSLPLIANMLIGFFPSLCSMWFLAFLGKDQLAAAGLATTSFYTVLTLFITGFSAVGIKVGHSLGSNKKEEVSYWVRNGFLLAILFSIPAGIILLSLPHVLLWMGQKPHLIAIATPFFQFGALAMIMILLNTAINQYFSGIGHPKIAFTLSIITLPLIVAVSYVLVLGKFGFHMYGLGGINLASFIIDSLVFLLGILILLFAKWSKPYQVFSSLKGVSWARCKELFSLGWPISLQVSGELLAMTVLIYLIGLFGVSALAAGQVVGQFTMLFVMTTIGLSTGVSILVSHSVGANRIIQMQKTSQAGLFLILMIAIVFAACFLFMPERLIDLYLDIKHPTHSMVVILGKQFMEVAAVYIIFDGIRNVMTSTLRGMQDAKIPMRIGLLSMWVMGIPLAALFGFVYPHGPVALRWGFTIAIILGTIWLWIRYDHQIKKRLNECC